MTTRTKKRLMVVLGGLFFGLAAWFGGGPRPSSRGARVLVPYRLPSGYRRADQGEVTPSMVAAARAALARPLGEVVVHDGFAVLVEPHWDKARGEHKGASVLLPTGET